MFEMSLNALRERIANLEVELGLDVNIEENDSAKTETSVQGSVVSQLATMQLQVKKILNSNEELKKVPQILRDFGSEIDSNVSQDEMLADLGGQAEKQERLSARMEAISMFLNSTTELQHLDLPPFPRSLINSLDVSTFEQNATKLQELTQMYEILVAKNLLVIYRFKELARKESEFWSKVDSRLLSLHGEAQNMTTKSNYLQL